MPALKINRARAALTGDDLLQNLSHAFSVPQKNFEIVAQRLRCGINKGLMEGHCGFENVVMGTLDRIVKPGSV